MYPQKHWKIRDFKNLTADQFFSNNKKYEEKWNDIASCKKHTLFRKTEIQKAY